MGFATVERIEARIEDLQGQEQAELREKLRQDYTLADFLLCQIETGDLDVVLLKMKEAHLKYLVRQVTRLTETKNNYRVCLDFAEDLEHYLTPEDFEAYQKKLIEKAIDNQWEITKL